MTNKDKAMIVFKRFLKVFLASFLTTAFAFVEMFGGWNVIITAFQKDIKGGLNILFGVLIVPLITSSVGAGINACAKLLRTEDYKGKITKFISNLF